MEDLLEKIRKIEALIAETQYEGERQAALMAKRRLQEKIGDEPREYTIRLQNSWSKRLFVAICGKHGLSTYRYARQKYTTAMVRVRKSFMDSVLWPEFCKYDEIFQKFAGDIMKDLVSKIYRVEEEDVIKEELLLS